MSPHVDAVPVPPEPLTAEPPREPWPVLLRQDWRDVAFLHWAAYPADVAPLLPPGTRPDVLDGRTFVGLVALRMERTAPLGAPPVPWVGSFGQVNARLYSVDDQGRRGVVFLSLDADRLPPVLAARALGLPYRWARVRMGEVGDRFVYRAERHSGTGRLRLELRPGAPLEPDATEHFVTARWAVHLRSPGRTVFGPVAHEPWQLHRAELLACDTDLLEASGLPVDDEPASVLWSPGVEGARIGLSVRPARAPSDRGRGSRGSRRRPGP
jgi:uncharacterized protein